GKASDPIYTMLNTVTDAEGALDYASSISIDWGAFIGAIINFLLIAVVLFVIIKTINTVSKKAAEVKQKAEEIKNAEEIAAKKAADEKAAQEAKDAAEKQARAEEEKAMANTRLLEEIRDLLKNK
ncbi:MAG: MscL family protein, partial [Clostridia bacterium]|nr:MscL family protein [Clostridia bacterium]